MRILIISEEFPPDTDWGGIASVSSDLAHGLIKAKQRVIVITKNTKNNKDRCDKYKVNNGSICIIKTTLNFNNSIINFIYFKFPLGIIRAFLKQIFPELLGIIEWNLAVFLCFKKINKTQKIDIVHSPEFHLGALFISIFTNIPIVVQLHGWKLLTTKLNNENVTLETKVIDYLEKMYVKKANGRIAISNSISRLAKKWLRINKKILTIYFPINFRYCKPTSYPHSKKEAILNFGRLEKRKGVDLLLLTFVQLAKKYKSLNLMFIGRDTQTFKVDGQQRNFKEYYHSLFIPIDIRKRIKFIPHLPRQKLTAYMQHAILGVFPSIYEPLGISIAEFMACGKSVIATKFGGPSEYIINNKNGLLIEPTVNCLYKTMYKYLKNYHRYCNLGKLARKTVMKKFNLENNTKKILKFYKFILFSYQKQ